MSAIITVLVLLTLGIDSHAQTGWAYLTETPERIIGLLDLPDVVAGGCGPAPKRATAAVFNQPTDKASRAGTIYWYEEADRACDLMIERPGGIKEVLPTLESGYEIPAAIVYERRGAWFRIRLKVGSVWIRLTTQENFLSYPEMLEKHLPDILQGWDGTLRATPGPAGPVTPLSKGWTALLDRTLSAQFLGSRKVENEHWIHVRLAAETPCGKAYEGVTDVTGWIPAYRPNGTPTMWFASRGC